jgi:hypothetical protein
MPDAGLTDVDIGGDGIAQVCIRKPSGSIKTPTTRIKLG